MTCQSQKKSEHRSFEDQFQVAPTSPSYTLAHVEITEKM